MLFESVGGAGGGAFGEGGGDSVERGGGGDEASGGNAPSPGVESRACSPELGPFPDVAKSTPMPVSKTRAKQMAAPIREPIGHR